MSIEDNTLYTTMLQSLIKKYGLFLNSRECAETLGISGRTLDQRRKSGSNCPHYVDQFGKKGIVYPAQAVVQFQLEKSKQAVQTA